MARQSCKVCGAELRLRPTHCPLCGSPAETAEAAPVPKDKDRYQADLRKLRAELKRLRDEAEAV